MPDILTRIKSAYTANDAAQVMNLIPELMDAMGKTVFETHALGDTVWDRFNNPWTVYQIDIYPKYEVLYRCGHSGTEDYCALYANEILTETAAREALEAQNGKD